MREIENKTDLRIKPTAVHAYPVSLQVLFRWSVVVTPERPLECGEEEKKRRSEVKKKPKIKSESLDENSPLQALLAAARLFLWVKSG